jgi:hypothetical protein
MRFIISFLRFDDEQTLFQNRPSRLDAVFDLAWRAKPASKRAGFEAVGLARKVEQT